MNKYLDLLGFDYYHRNIKKRIDQKNIFIKYWSDKTPEEILVDTDNPPKEGDYFFKTDTNTLYQFQKEQSGELIRLVANPINPIPQNSLYIRNDDNRLFKWDGEQMKYTTAYPGLLELSNTMDYSDKYILPKIVQKETGSQIKIRKNLKVDQKYNKTDVQKTHVHYSPEQIYFLAGKDRRLPVSSELSIEDAIGEPGSQIHLTKDKVNLIGRDQISTYSGSAYFNTKNNLNLNGGHNVEISTGSEYIKDGAVANKIELESPNIGLIADLLEVNATKTYLQGNTLETSTHRTYLDSKLFEVGSNKTYLQSKDLCEISASKIYCQAQDVFEVSAYETYAQSGFLEVSAEDTYFRTKFLEMSAEESYISLGNLEVSSRSGYIYFDDKLETSAQNTYIRVKDLNEIHSQNTKIRAREDVDLIARNIILEGQFTGGEKPLKLEIKNFDEVSFGTKYITSPTKDLLFKPSPDESAIPIIRTLRESKEVTSAALNDLYKNLIEDEKVTSAALNDLNTRVIEINNKIPSEASSSNQLADKDYVNSSIATSTATFRGVYNSVEELEEAETDADLNDYAYVKLTDATGNTQYDRYKWGSRGWMYEYTLNNSNFTAAQWAAINSGITAEIVEWLNNLVVDVKNAQSYTTIGGRVFVWDDEPIVRYLTYREEGDNHDYWHMVFKDSSGNIRDFSKDIDSSPSDPYTLDASYTWDNAPLRIKSLFKDDNSYISTTYSDLVLLKNSEQLVPGVSYRIVDYITTTSTPETQSAEHPFDIIVTALDNKTLDEHAKVIQTEIRVDPITGEGDHDDYFDESNLNAWEIKYCIDNDSDRFEWADETDGKGVIYYMKDEYNNECPYDFKNIMFEKTIGTKHDFYYTFSWITNIGIVQDASIVGQDESLADSIVIGVHNNIIKPTYASERTSPEDVELLLLALNNIIFVSSASYDNGYFLGIVGNTFDQGCNKMVFRDNSNRNCFGKYCKNNQFDVECSSNIIGNNYQDNICSQRFVSNIIGNNCQNNNFTTGFVANIIEMNCNHITTLIEYISNIVIESNNQYIQITSTATSSPQIQIQNFTISQGTNTTNVVKTISHNTTGDTFKTIYQNPNSVIVNV